MSIYIKITGSRISSVCISQYRQGIWDKGLTDEAAKQFMLAVQTDTHHYQPRISLYMLSMNKKNLWYAALSYLEKDSQNSWNFKVFFDLGCLYYMQERYVESLQAFTNACRLDYAATIEYLEAGPPYIFVIPYIESVIRKEGIKTKDPLRLLKLIQTSA